MPSREEIKETLSLLKTLDVIRSLKNCTGQYNRGKVTISVDGNAGTGKIDLILEPSKPKELHPADREIEQIAAGKVMELLIAAENIILKHLPIEVTDVN